jgi:hypothetical protein
MAIARESLKASPIAPAKMAATPPQIAIHANFFGSVTIARFLAHLMNDDPICDPNSSSSTPEAQLNRRMEGEMRFKTILAGVSGGSASNGALELACRFAERCGAHLEAFSRAARSA